MMRRRTGTALLICLWLTVWLTYSRYSMLDDALIHMRYANNLRAMHAISYDGIHQGFGTSSPLYVLFLAVFSYILPDVFAPKLLSCSAYLLLIALLFRHLFRMRQEQTKLVTGLLLCVCLSPMAVRWLTDGMETSLVLLSLYALASVTLRSLLIAQAGLCSNLCRFSLGLLMVLLRVELLLPIVLVTLGLIVYQVGKPDTDVPIARSAARILSLVCGAVCGVGVILAVFGTVLPDTALAKSSHASLGPIKAIAQVFLTAFFFGVGSVLVYCVSVFDVIRSLGKQRNSRALYLFCLVVNACFPALIVLSCLRGQAIQGVRYVVWPLFFTSLLNIGVADELHVVVEESSLRRISPTLVTIALSVLLVLFIFDFRYAKRCLTGRATTFVEMRGDQLQQYAGQHIVAGDVGFIGFFTRGTICDIDGLVNGRAAAERSRVKRIAMCFQGSPTVLFLTDDQALQLGSYTQMAEWERCKSYDFTNVGSDDRHFLYVRHGSSLSCPVRPN